MSLRSYYYYQLQHVKELSSFQWQYHQHSSKCKSISCIANVLVAGIVADIVVAVLVELLWDFLQLWLSLLKTT